MRFLKYSRALYLHAYLTGYFDAAIVAITRVSSVRAFPYTAVHCLIHRRDGIGPILQVKITQLFGWPEIETIARGDQPFHQIYIALL